MKYQDLTDVQNNLPALLNEIADFQEQVTITQNGVAVAMILPVKGIKKIDKQYPLRGQPIWIAEDFDEPMPELWDAVSE
ncbi:MAG: type II toxin-antitoxin system prevent-host-death family antitoxin [Crinalium sp.]